MPLIPALGRQRQVDFSVEVSLVYRVSSRTARDTQRNPVSKNKNNTKKPSEATCFPPTAFLAHLYWCKSSITALRRGRGRQIC